MKCTRCHKPTFSKDPLCELDKIVLLAQQVVTDFRYMKNNKNNYPEKRKYTINKEKRQGIKWTSCPATPCFVCGKNNVNMWHTDAGTMCGGCKKVRDSGRVNAC